jgi:hypothetical protein
MKLESKYFDMIRVSRGRGASTAAAKTTAAPPDIAASTCQWRGCTKAGAHRAPKGRGRDNEFFLFCAAHIKDYNHSYNYFEGMSSTEVEDFCKDALTGHRPTWAVGANSWAHGTKATQSEADLKRFADQRGGTAQDAHAARARKARAEAPEGRRILKPLERKSLEVLDLTQAASKDDIKARFKEMVKRHHPDLNGGDRSTEDKLREIIQAYNMLKQAGMV